MIFRVKYKSKVYTELTQLSPERCVMDAIFGKDLLPYDKEHWDDVVSVHCPNCGDELRYSKKSLDELLTEDVDGFTEFCPECGKLVDFEL